MVDLPFALSSFILNTVASISWKPVTVSVFSGTLLLIPKLPEVAVVCLVSPFKATAEPVSALRVFC